LDLLASENKLKGVVDFTILVVSKTAEASINYFS
jgi:hypothetical protein